MKYHWLFLGSASVCVAAAACSQKVGSNPGSTSSSGTPTATSTTTGGGGTSTTSTAGPGTGGSGTGGQCKTPGMLHPPKMGATDTIYCPFSGTPNVSCTKVAQHCCEPTSGMSKCIDAKTACGAGDTDWTCQDPTDCPQGQKCCSNDGATLVVNPNMNCANYATQFHGTVCAASCAATQITMCTDDMACGGKKCTAFNTKGAQVGGCH